MRWVSALVRQYALRRRIDVRPMDPAMSLPEMVRQVREKLGFRAQVRAGWGTSEDAFEWWRRRVEAQGVLAVMLPLEPGEARGASMWEDPAVPAVLINRGDQAAGRLFTLLHEYAHLLLRQSGAVCDFCGGDEGQGMTEVLPNRLAARLLLTQEEFAARLGELELAHPRSRWSDRLLDEVRGPFRVSRDVVAIFLEEQALAPPGFYRRKRAAWERQRPFFRGGPGGNTHRTRREQRLRMIGYGMAGVLSSLFAAGKVSVLDLSEVLELKVERAEEFMEWVRSAGLDRDGIDAGNDLMS